MTRRRLQVAARCVLAILMVATGPTNLFALALRPALACGCAAQSEAPCAADGVVPDACCCCHHNEPPAEEDSSDPEQGGDGGQSGEDARGPELRPACPCCPVCPHCPLGPCSCGVAKAPGLVSSALHSPPQPGLDSLIAELQVHIPSGPATELLQVPRS